MLELIWLIPILPLLGFLINGMLAKRFNFSEKLIGGVAVASVFLAFVISVLALISYSSWVKTANNPTNSTNQTTAQKQAAPPYVAKQFSYTWITGGKAVLSEGQSKADYKLADFRIEWSYQIDHLSGLYILFITFVGLLIHIFAIGYMKGEAGFARFFAYLNLFMFMMLTLVLGSNLLMLFVGWEGVGLCSYLLIGFYLTKNDAAQASKKAFILNRVGDLGLVLAIIALFSTFGTLQYYEIANLVQSYPVETLGTFGLMSGIALGLFIGATGKSAQIPLYIWLPDAMTGPTPVSALIHAATMVTAGVYLLARMNMIFQRSLTMMLVVALVGSLTAFIAATIAVTQKDIKKILAYSTISQIGYMFLGCGVGAFIAAVFHVVTHAFFKAQLFLGAGSVVHNMHHEQDITRMGGLKKYLPTTHKTMIIGWLAICGIAPLAGFWSKDEILAKAFTTTLFHPVLAKFLWAIGFLTVGITSFYMTRLMALTFWSEQKFLGATANDGGEEVDEYDEKEKKVTIESSEEHKETNTYFRIKSVTNKEEIKEIEKIEEEKQETNAVVKENISALVANPKESPALMTLPLVILAFFAATLGFIGLPFGYNLIDDWLLPSIEVLNTGTHTFGGLDIILAALSLTCSLTGIYLAHYIYVKNPQLADTWADKLKPLYQISIKKWYWDDLLDNKFVILVKKLNDLLAEGEHHVLDAIPNGSALVTRGVSILSGAMDRYGVDLVVNLTGLTTRAGSLIVRSFHTGFLGNYALFMILGIILIIFGLEYQAIKDFYSYLFPAAPKVPPTVP